MEIRFRVPARPSASTPLLSGSEPQKVVVGVRLEGDAATTTYAFDRLASRRETFLRCIRSPRPHRRPGPTRRAHCAPWIAPTSFDQQTSPIAPAPPCRRAKIVHFRCGSWTSRGVRAPPMFSMIWVRVRVRPPRCRQLPPRRHPLPSDPRRRPSPASPDPLTGGRAEYPLFGGGLDLGRGYAPRGFGGIPREPECESTSASSTPRPSRNQRRDQPRAYVVRFFENVTAETFREVSRARWRRAHPRRRTIRRTRTSSTRFAPRRAGLPEGTSFPSRRGFARTRRISNRDARRSSYDAGSARFIARVGD